MAKYIWSVTGGILFGFFLVIVGALGASVFAAPAGKGKTPGLVDCTAGDSIAAALAAGVTDITVRGVCDERFDIKTSDVTLTAENPGDGIAYTADTQTAVTIRGAQEVSLVGMTISGPGRALNVFANGAAFITDSDLSSTTPDTHASFVGDNSFANIRNTTIGGLIVIRNGDVRLFGTTINSPGAGQGNLSNTAMILNHGSASVWGGDFNGHVVVNWLSQLNFGQFFQGTNWDVSNLTNNAGSLAPAAMQCAGYSVIFASPQGIVEDGAGGDLTTADIIDFIVGDDTEAFCSKVNFPAPAP